MDLVMAVVIWQAPLRGEHVGIEIMATGFVVILHMVLGMVQVVIGMGHVVKASLKGLTEVMTMTTRSWVSDLNI